MKSVFFRVYHFCSNFSHGIDSHNSLDIAQGTLKLQIKVKWTEYPYFLVQKKRHRFRAKIISFEIRKQCYLSILLPK